MRTKLLLPVALVAVTAMGVTAASGIGSATGERSALAGNRERVNIDVHREASGSAGAASAITSAKKGKPKILHLVGNQLVTVPAGGSSAIARIKCPRKAKLLSGDYATDGGITPDWFAAASAKAFEFGFISFRADDAEASIGIFCAKGVK